MFYFTCNHGLSVAAVDMTAEGIIQPTATRGSYELCPPSVVLRSRDMIQPLVSAAVDVFWQCRRYGEPWDEVTPPQSYLAAADDDGDDEEAGVCALSRRVHRLLVFDLVAEILRDIYDDDDAVDVSPLYDDKWPRHRPPQRRPRRFAVAQPVPTTVDLVKPIVERHVFSCFGLAYADELYSTAAWTTTAKKRGVDRRMRDDAVDRMLVEELCLEEPGWVDYDDDTTTRKLQLSDWLQEALLADTIYAVDNALCRRQDALASLNSLV